LVVPVAEPAARLAAAAGWTSLASAPIIVAPATTPIEDFCKKSRRESLSIGSIPPCHSDRFGRPITWGVFALPRGLDQLMFAKKTGLVVGAEGQELDSMVTAI
jgi:hypothetical protein